MVVQLLAELTDTARGHTKPPGDAGSRLPTGEQLGDRARPFSPNGRAVAVSFGFKGVPPGYNGDASFFEWTL